MSFQNDFDSISGMLEQCGSLAAFEEKYGCGPNCYAIRCQGVRVIRKLSAAVRAELMRAVKSGQLGRLAKSGLKPEVFFHPNSKGKAIEKQNQEHRMALESLKKVFVPHENL